ncbi:hypothetical protein EDI_306180 [Entamoeba dispar SAW760]|uniref:Uncharacterized protein n=1 Tax=Entamoeba dispar (strain ATCC PRA-260 / SAW760) TaxID=370354 RepID=B0EMK3_ENTDS|nr:uncharacterized protein EDI_306180 [Entamoeba dispar SAW760]EDR24249.1 hypothetical protein EDI_306180 [Entamoeba dispar SAW760]|eukprot:EDR24249.1 hypothetical protein EDI_306180 [Entamoeba dispar SAW760]
MSNKESPTPSLLSMIQPSPPPPPPNKEIEDSITVNSQPSVIDKQKDQTQPSAIPHSSLSEFNPVERPQQQPVAQEEITEFKKKQRKLRDESERVKWQSNAEFIKDVLTKDRTKAGETKPRKIIPFNSQIEKKLEEIIKNIRKDLQGIQRISAKMC